MKKKDKFIEESILNFDDGELVDNKNVLICEDQNVILEKQHNLEESKDGIVLPSMLNYVFEWQICT